MNILVTGAAGFIGFHLCRKLLNKGHDVVGLDNINLYYSTDLKIDRLVELGVEKRTEFPYNELISGENKNFQFIKINLEDRDKLPVLFENCKFDKVINLAAQAGVRYSLENPEAYVDSNIVGFSNLLECCRHAGVKDFIFASSSSVYGQNEVPFSTTDRVDRPVSLYAATKKSNELIAYTYSHLYGIKTTGLRFFTVYGPWGRPDMAIFLFAKAIAEDKPIKVFNDGKLERDFTYIDDIVAGINSIVTAESKTDYALYNIGNGKPVRLLDFIEILETEMGKPAKKELYPMQPGDVYKTWADVSDLKKDFNYNPQWNIEAGVTEFVKWFKGYYKI